LDVAGLERLLQALARLGAALQRDLQVALELFQPLRSQQYRFGEVHCPAIRNNTRHMDPSDLRAELAERLAGAEPIDAQAFNAACFMLSRALEEIEFTVPEAAPLVRRMLRVAGRVVIDTGAPGASP